MNHVARLVYGNTVTYRWAHNQVGGFFALTKTEDKPAASVFDAFSTGERTMRNDAYQPWCGPRRASFFESHSPLSQTSKEWLYSQEQEQCNRVTDPSDLLRWTYDDMYQGLTTWTANGNLVTLRGNDTEIAVLETYTDVSQVDPGVIAAAAAARLTAENILLSNPDFRKNVTTSQEYDTAIAQARDLETVGKWALIRDPRALGQGRIDAPNWPSPSGGACSYITLINAALTAAAQAYEPGFDMRCDTQILLPGTLVQSRYTGRTVYAVGASGDADNRLSAVWTIAPGESAQVIERFPCGSIRRLVSASTSEVTNTGFCLKLQKQQASNFGPGIGAQTNNTFSQSRQFNRDYYFHEDDFVSAATTKIGDSTLRWVPFATIAKATGFSVLQSVTVSKKSVINRNPNSDVTFPQCHWVGKAESNWPYSLLDMSFGGFQSRTRQGDAGAVGDLLMEKRINPTTMTAERINHDMNLCAPHCAVHGILGRKVAERLGVHVDQTACGGTYVGERRALPQVSSKFQNQDIQVDDLRNYFDGKYCKDLAKDVSGLFSTCWETRRTGYEFKYPDLAAMYLADIGWGTLMSVWNTEHYPPALMKQLCKCEQMPELVSKHAELLEKCAHQHAFIGGGLASRATMLQISSLVSRLEYGCQRSLGRELMVDEKDGEYGYCFENEVVGGSPVTSSRHNNSAYLWVPPKGCTCMAHAGYPALCSDDFAAYPYPACYVNTTENPECPTGRHVGMTDKDVGIAQCDRVPQSLLENKELKQWHELIAGNDGSFRVIISQAPSMSPVFTPSASTAYRTLALPWTLWGTPTNQEQSTTTGFTDTPVERNDYYFTLPPGTKVTLDTSAPGIAPIDQLRYIVGNFTEPLMIKFQIPETDVNIMTWKYKQVRTPTVALCNAMRSQSSCCMSSEVAAYRRIAKLAYGFTWENGKIDRMTTQVEGFIASCRRLGVTVPGGAVGLELSWQAAMCKPVVDMSENTGVECGTDCTIGLSVIGGLLGICGIYSMCCMGEKPTDESLEEEEEEEELEETPKE